FVDSIPLGNGDQAEGVDLFGFAMQSIEEMTCGVTVGVLHGNRSRGVVVGCLYQRQIAAACDRLLEDVPRRSLQMVVLVPGDDPSFVDVFDDVAGAVVVQLLRSSEQYVRLNTTIQAVECVDQIRAWPLRVKDGHDVAGAVVLVRSGEVKSGRIHNPFDEPVNAVVPL